MSVTQISDQSLSTLVFYYMIICLPDFRQKGEFAMQNTEKIKFHDGAVYELVTDGVYFADDKAQITFLPGEKTYEQIEDDLTGCNRIEILDTFGETMEAHSGYAYLDTLTKKKDYTIGTEQVEDGQDDNGDAIYINRDVTGTVMIATLKKSDIRKQIDDLQETVDMILLADLEV